VYFALSFHEENKHTIVAWNDCSGY